METESLLDAGTYNYAVYFELTDYPEVSASVPLTVKILRQPASPISILPKPKSSYTLSPGSNLLLSFEISSPYNAEIVVTVDCGTAKTFTTVEADVIQS